MYKYLKKGKAADLNIKKLVSLFSTDTWESNVYRVCTGT